MVLRVKYAVFPNPDGVDVEHNPKPCLAGRGFGSRIVFMEGARRASCAEPSTLVLGWSVTPAMESGGRHESHRDMPSRKAGLR